MNLQATTVTTILGFAAVLSSTSVSARNDEPRFGLSTRGSIRELTGFINHRISDNRRTHVYALTGSSDSSADLGGGVLIRHTFQ